MKFSIKDYFSKSENWETADLVIFTEEILNSAEHRLGSFSHGGITNRIIAPQYSIKDTYDLAIISTLSGL